MTLILALSISGIISLFLAWRMVRLNNRLQCYIEKMEEKERDWLTILRIYREMLEILAVTTLAADKQPASERIAELMSILSAMETAKTEGLLPNLDPDS